MIFCLYFIKLRLHQILNVNRTTPRYHRLFHNITSCQLDCSQADKSPRSDLMLSLVMFSQNKIPASSLSNKSHLQFKFFEKVQINFLAILGDSKHFSGFLVPQIFFLTTNLIFFYELKPHARFRNPTITPSGSKVSEGERERDSGHLVPCQRTQAVRTNIKNGISMQPVLGSYQKFSL